MTRVWVDGEPGDQIAVADRGLQYGDGLFETIACRAGRIRFLELHLARLQRGAEVLALPLPPLSLLRAELTNAAAAGAAVSLLKLIVTRGVAGRGYAPPAAPTANRILWHWTDEPAPPERCARLGVAAMRLAASPRLAGIKHLNRLEQVLGRAELASAGWDEALMLTADGAVACATAANIFAVVGGLLRTPRIDTAGIRGVMRAVVLREAPKLGLPVEEGRLTLPELAAASELFLTNARVGVLPVEHLQGVFIGAGPIAARIRTHVASLDD